MLKHLRILVVICIALGTVSGPAFATKVFIIRGSEKQSVCSLISKGPDPLEIRVVSIHDPDLVSAIRKGSRSRIIRILIDRESSEIESLIGFRNVDIRISAPKRKAWFGSQAMKSSFLMVRGKEGCQMWNGKLSWTSSIFGNEMLFYVADWMGLGPARLFRTIAKTFDHEFSLASKLNKPAPVAPSHKPILL